ncbi:hypothetical protein SMB34_00315 [Thalassospira permensis NBRC 106175]|uniref:Uncharacterized protein n=1 Tax=Thalassospira permensis NBRC 106175 TaxID=1353532 RepID=A0ABR4TVW3_9PROT|nr:hypothetical protein SMB34_00315 [Thalassospira permensis NBRC 106175]
MMTITQHFMSRNGLQEKDHGRNQTVGNVQAQATTIAVIAITPNARRWIIIFSCC